MMEEFWQQIEKAAEEVEGFFKDVSSAMESLADEFGKTLTTFTEEVEEIVVTEIEHCIDDLIEIIYEESDWEENGVYWEDFSDFVESEFMDVRTHKSSPDNHPACMGCLHYHGKAYNGNLLVCAMHPYGCEDTTCPDWEGISEQ